MRGFTVLELLIVMLIMGLMVALVGPRMLTAFESVTRAYTRDDILVQINGLGFQAYRQGLAFKLEQWPLQKNAAQSDKPAKNPRLNSVPLNLPDNWSLLARPPIQFRTNGTCSGGKLTLTHADVNIYLRLDPPFCQAVLR